MNEHSALLHLATHVRRGLEPIWPHWHHLRRRPLPDPLSFGTCQTSSLVLAEFLRARGWHSEVFQGNTPGATDGLFVAGIWHGHAWVSCGDWIVDITADQFGLPPVRIRPSNDPDYRAGAIDTASADAIRQRQTLARYALSRL